MVPGRDRLDKWHPFQKCILTCLMHIMSKLNWIDWTLSSVQSLSRVQLFATPWTAARQASLPITNSWSLLKLMFSSKWYQKLSLWIPVLYWISVPGEVEKNNFIAHLSHKAHLQPFSFTAWQYLRVQKPSKKRHVDFSKGECQTSTQPGFCFLQQ